MPLTPIQTLRKEIYNFLAQDKKIEQFIKKIYIGPVHDAKSSFITINFEEINNVSLYGRIVYQINFNICAYAKDQHHQQLLELSDLILISLDELVKSRKVFRLLSLRTNKIIFEKAKDLVSNKLLINCKACVDGGGY